MKKKYCFYNFFLILIYLLILFLMDVLFKNMQNNLYKTMDIYENFYLLNYLLLSAIVFFKWFILGVLLSLLEFNIRPKVQFFRFYFVISTISMIIFILMSIGIFSFIPFYGNPNLENQIYITLPIFTGFFLVKALFSNKTS